MWIGFTLLAAFMQAWRNALQSKLSQDVSITGVTLARFIAAGPIAALYLAILYQTHSVPKLSFSNTFYLYIAQASLMQIIATALMVKLFTLKNYAVGAGLAKSEAIVAAVFGLMFFGVQLTALGWAGVAVGALAVMVLSGAFKLNSASRLSNESKGSYSWSTVLLGLACGSAFALTSLSVREASLQLQGPYMVRAAWVLLLVISSQTLILVSYLLLKQRQTLVKLWHNKRLTLAVSVTSCIGSIGWFSAMALESVPLVKTLGQIEVFFMLLIGRYWLKQPNTKSDVLGLLLIAIAALLVIWG
ncbi:multidrug transporter [Shewanella sp. WXL01]|uniref:multidrug transporter n=1 Tax=Shewanella sp. WXL01 TaxID=2709721 RepID=UPI0014384C4C|nr:multidrug transporter [Shewanella sp. WXL01]NKF49606.1 multidrug transporter [Shewanella sp. WXL01]